MHVDSTKRQGAAGLTIASAKIKAELKNQEAYKVALQREETLKRADEQSTSEAGNLLRETIQAGQLSKHAAGGRQGVSCVLFCVFCLFSCTNYL